MPDREKVVKELHDLRRYLEDKEWSANRVDRRTARVYWQTVTDAIAMLKEQAWHLLKEDADGLIRGLPGDDGQYLMTDGEDIWIDDYADGVDDGVWLDSGRDIREIKAWMYMPDPPKQEGR